MLKVYSARIEPWDLGRVASLASRVRAPLLDVTWKTGGELGSVFAPSKAIFNPAYEAKERAKAMRKKYPEAAKLVWDEAWATYQVAYLDEQRARWKQNREPYDRLLAEPAIVLLCYCHYRGPPIDDGCCHRHLLRRLILPALGGCNAGELGVEYPAYRVAVTGTRPPRAPKGPTDGPLALCANRCGSKTTTGICANCAQTAFEQYDKERRIYDKLAAVCRGTILGLDPGAVVVHGDADGMDSIARDTARERWLVDEAHPPKPEEHGGDYRAACLARNVYVETADWVAALPSPWSRGSWHAIKLAEQAGVRVERCWERVDGRRCPG